MYWEIVVRQKHQGMIGCGHAELRLSKDYTGVSALGDQQEMFLVTEQGNANK